MARLSRVGVAALVTATVAAAGVGAYVWSRRRCSAAAGPRRPRGRAASPAPSSQQRAPAPPEGYEARWEALREAALESCRRDPDVMTWAQAVTCALNHAYPEAAPWTDPGIWSTWMQSAAALVEADLAAAASRDGQSPRAWEVVVWLRGHRELAVCRSEGVAGRIPDLAARCVAFRLYPRMDWKSPSDQWQLDMLAALSQIAEAA